MNFKNSLNEKVELLFKVFPHWNLQAMKRCEVVLQELRSSFLSQYPSAEYVQGKVNVHQIVDFTFQSKSDHQLAVVGSYLSSMKDINLIVELLTLLELIIVDISDSLGDYGMKRSQEDSKKIYKNAYEIFTDKPISLLDFDDKRHTASLNFLFMISQKAKKTLDMSYVDRENVQLLYSRCLQLTKNYGECVEIMHIQDKDHRSSVAKKYLMESKKSRNILPWLNDENLWFNAQGTPVGVFGLIVHALSNPIIEFELEKIVDFYDQVIPFLHVLLDDVVDLEEDSINGDYNLLESIRNGDFTSCIENLKTKYDFHKILAELKLLEKFELNEENKFFFLVALEYLEKEKRLIESTNIDISKVHTQSVRDMFKLYSIKRSFMGESTEAELLKNFNLIVTRARI